MIQRSSRPLSQMDRSEVDEMRDAETLAGLANAPSAGASAGIGERPSSSGAKRKTKVLLGFSEYKAAILTGFSPQQVLRAP